MPIKDIKKIKKISVKIEKSCIIKVYMELKNKKIWVAGHNGLVGSSICEKLMFEDCKILKIDRAKLDLMNYERVHQWMSKSKPDIIILAAARVGGINANKSFPANFITENLVIQTNVIRLAHELKVEKLIFLGSSCAYPISSNPLKESDLLTARPEPTNQAYAIAKIAGIEMCNAYQKQYKNEFISILPSNLYGENDNFSEKVGHVIPALISKIDRAKEKNEKSVEIWGTGKPLREFLHIDDFSDALIFLIKQKFSYSTINVGSGHEISIKNLAKLIAKNINFKGKITFNDKFPDGVMRKFLDSSKLLNLGWKRKINLDTGIKRLYKWYKENEKNVKK